MIFDYVSVLCIRLAQGQHRFLSVHGSNHYGITINCIVNYLNDQFKNYNEDTVDKYHYELSHEIMPGDDFLSSLKIRNLFLSCG